MWPYTIEESAWLARTVSPRPTTGLSLEEIDLAILRGRHLRAQAAAAMLRRMAFGLARPFRRRRGASDTASKRAFVAGIAEELKTPLTAIRSFSEILRDNPDLPRGERARYLDIIIAENARLDRLLTEMLAKADPAQAAGSKEPAAVSSADKAA